MEFDNEECYNYVTINETDNPVIPSSDVTIILMMEGSTRFKNDPFILSLSKKTIIQYNKGYRNCVKDEEISSTTSDITHSYYTAFYYLREYNNVIILEEDAEMYSKDLDDYALVNNFIENEDFNVFTFGSSATFKKYKPDVYEGGFYSLIGYTFAQAQMFTKKCRQDLYKTIGGKRFSGDIDADYISKLDKIYSYKYPLIIQLFPATENKSNWGGTYVIGKLGIVPMKALLMFVELDKDASGWETIYAYNKCKQYIDFLILFIFLSLLIKLISKLNIKFPRKLFKKTFRNYRK